MELIMLRKEEEMRKEEQEMSASQAKPDWARIITTTPNPFMA